MCVSRPPAITHMYFVFCSLQPCWVASSPFQQLFMSIYFRLPWIATQTPKEKKWKKDLENREKIRKNKNKQKVVLAKKLQTGDEKESKSLLSYN